VKEADSAAKAFSALRKQMRETVTEEIFPAISAIDKGEFDDHNWIDGKWEKKGGDTD
jgi:hypothetical protein